MARTRVALCLLAALLFATGCGQKLVPVTGKVTVNGQPVGNLQVSFEHTGDGQGVGLGFTKADGTYQVHYPGSKVGAPPGDYVVRITPSETDDPASAAPAIPAKYNTASELSATVDSGKTNFDFDLTIP